MNYLQNYRSASRILIDYIDLHLNRFCIYFFFTWREIFMQKLNDFLDSFCTSNKHFLQIHILHIFWRDVSNKLVPGRRISLQYIVLLNILSVYDVLVQYCSYIFSNEQNTLKSIHSHLHTRHKFWQLNW